jgi:hypothetical protein
MLLAFVLSGWMIVVVVIAMVLVGTRVVLPLRVCAQVCTGVA